MTLVKANHVVQSVKHYIIKYSAFVVDCTKLLTFHLFADDTNIYCSCKNLNDLELKLNRELKAVAEWMKSNRLALSILKTNFILFHSKKLKPHRSFSPKIDGVNIQQVSTVKYPGVTFDSNLTWKNHIDEICLKLSNYRNLLKIEIVCWH